MTKLVVTHEMGFAWARSPTVVRDGAVTQSGWPVEFFSSRRTERASRLPSKVLSH